MMATLATAGMCSGLALVGIFLATQPRIERNRAEALQAAIFQVLPGASSRQAWIVEDESLVPFESAEGRLPRQEAVYAGYDAEGRLVGWAIPAEGSGFQDTIKLIYGYDPDRERVVGLQVLESRETPGLGDKIVKDESFLADFRDLAVSPPVVAVKSGRSRDNEVDAISGATISSVAVVRIINEANERWLRQLPRSDSSAAARTAPRPGGGGT
jgi:electron transport complex protein RnfG